MGSSSKLVSVLMVLAYMTSFLLAATSIVAAPQPTTEATTPAVEPAEGTTGNNLKVYGNIHWDVNQDGDSTDHNDLGEYDEWDANDPDDDDIFDRVIFEPAYDDDTRISGSSEDGFIDNNLDNMLFHLEGQYHPTFWMPLDSGSPDGTDHASIPMSRGDGLFDIDEDEDFDFDQIDDEDFDTTIDSNNGDDPIDLVGVDDNIVDFSSRNDDIGEGDDIYFPAWKWRYIIAGYNSANERVDIDEGDEITVPLSGLGGQPGLNSQVVVPGGQVETALVQDIADTPNDGVRFEVQDVQIEEGDTVRFWDFQATVESINFVSGGQDDVRMSIEWLGDYDNPQQVGSDVTGTEDTIFSASRTSTSSTTSGVDCRAIGSDSGRPGFGDSVSQPWYICIETISTGGDTNSVFLTVGRTFTDRDEEVSKASILVNGVFYSVEEIEDENTSPCDPCLESLRIEQAVPFGEDVDLPELDAILKGTPAGDPFPVFPPFNEDGYTALDNFDVPAERNSYGFLQDRDGDTDATPNIIEEDDIDLDDGARDIDDRKVSRSPLEVSWEVAARETGLLTNRETPDQASSAWDTQINQVMPHWYAEINMPSEGNAMVLSGLYQALTGHDHFVWKPGEDNSVHFGSSVRLFSEHVDETGGDDLLVNPAVITEGDVRASGSNADTLVELSLKFCKFCRFDDISADGGDPGGEDADGDTDLNIESDEEFKSAGGSDLDTDSDHHPHDEDGDNLADLEGEQNNVDQEGDIYGPGIRQTYTVSFVNQGDGQPTEADIPDDLVFGPNPISEDNTGFSASNSKLQLSAASQDAVGDGLDSLDLDGDGTADEIFLGGIDLGQETEQTDLDVGILQAESESLTISVGERAHFLDYAVEVQSTDTSYSPKQTRLAIFQLQEEGVTNNDVATFPGANEDEYVGVRHNYDAGSATAVGPSDCLDNEDTDPSDGCNNGDDDADFDWWVRVDNIASDAVTLHVGRFVPGTHPMYIDGQQLLFTGATGTACSPCTELFDFSLERTTPIGNDVQVQDPSLEIAAIGNGDAVPLLAPFNGDHQVVDNINPPLEQDEYGAYDPTKDNDDDRTEEDYNNRIIDAPALEITLAGTGRHDNSFIWLDQRNTRGTGTPPDGEQQHVVGIFEGNVPDDDTPGGNNDCNEDGSDIGEGPLCAGWPDSSFDNTPAEDTYTGNVLTAAWDKNVPNEQRGYTHYAALDVPSGHGEFILDSGRIADFGDGDGDDGGPNIYEWLQTETGTLGGVSGDDCETAFGSTAVAPCIAAFGTHTDSTASDAAGWFSFASSNILGLFIGDGTVPEGQERTPEEQAQIGRNPIMDVQSISCDPTTVTQGQAVSCNVTVKNTGTSDGSGTVTLAVTHQGGSHVTDRAVAQVSTGTIAVGGTAEVTLIWSTTSQTTAGTWQMTGKTGSSDVTQSTTVTVEAPDQPDGPNVQVQSCSVSGTVKIGSSVSASVTFENTGDQAGSDTFDIAVDGSNVASVNSGNVPAGGTKTVTAQATLDASNVDLPEPSEGEAPTTSVAIAVGGTNCGSVTVEGEVPPTDGEDRPTIPGFETVAMVAAMGAALVLLRRD